jgi:hypothetical protein
MIAPSGLWEWILKIIAEVFRKRGDSDRAIQYWGRYLEKNPRSVEGHCALIELYSEAGKNNLLTKTIDQLLNIQVGEDLHHFIDDTTHSALVPVYIPDTEKIVSIISNYTPVKHGSM